MPQIFILEENVQWQCSVHGREQLLYLHFFDRTHNLPSVPGLPGPLPHAIYANLGYSIQNFFWSLPYFKHLDLGLVKTYIFCLEISQNWRKVIFKIFLTLRQKKRCILFENRPEIFFLVQRKNFEEDWGVFLETFKKAPLLPTSKWINNSHLKFFYCTNFQEFNLPQGHQDPGIPAFWSHAGVLFTGETFKN